MERDEDGNVLEAAFEEAAGSAAEAREGVAAELDGDGADGHSDMLDHCADGGPSQPIEADGGEAEAVAKADDEVIELEFDEDDIECYLVDEDGNEVGFTLLDEDGNEVEYYYAEEDAEPAEGSARSGSRKISGEDEEFEPLITREGVAQATADCNSIYREGLATAAEFKEAFDDIKEALDFSSIFKK